MDQRRTSNKRRSCRTHPSAEGTEVTATSAGLAVSTDLPLFQDQNAKARHQSRRAEPPVEVVDIAEIPGGGLLHLLKCGEDFSIQFGKDELMGSRNHVSEQALATLTCQRLTRNDGHVLVGGLGMGFTLGAVLANWAPSSSVVVAELVPRIVTWAHGHLAHLFGTNLSDPRVSLQLADVHDVISEQADRFDAILLDVDNGPDGFITPANDRLYCDWGLRAAYTALRPKGVLAVWSAYSDLEFFERLEKAGFAVEETKLPASAGCVDDWHSIWFASKPGAEIVAAA
ncbi:spermidine synthase [Sphingobium sp. EM0848]|uniref:spermidine synthase n=1 Tax=Sphingobium sp. EM0848 TaxID=2743473 RepID=UPI0021014851|nr:spermidine synthase [Sphingobium sp. EM0848]